MNMIRKLQSYMKNLLLSLAMLLIIASIAEAATRYVSPTGSGTTCSDSAPCSLTQGLSVTRSGDTLYLKGGTYATGLLNPIPSGLSNSQPTILAGKPGDIAIIRPNTEVRPLRLSIARSDITFRNLVLDGVNLKTSLDGFNISNTVLIKRLILEDMEIKNLKGSAVTFGSDVTNSVIRRSRLHDVTGIDSDGAHCVYLRGSYNVIEYNECYNTWATGITMRTYDSAFRNIIRYNFFRNNATNLAVTNGGRAINCSAADNTVHDNIIILSGEEGITATGDCKNVKIYNNTIYKNRRHGIYLTGGASGEIKNNIIYLNGGSSIANFSTGGWSMSNNYTQDPLFVDPNNYNFSLKTGSPATGLGADLNTSTANTNTTTAPTAPSTLQAIVQ